MNFQTVIRSVGATGRSPSNTVKDADNAVDRNDDPDVGAGFKPARFSHDQNPEGSFQTRPHRIRHACGNARCMPSIASVPAVAIKITAHSVPQSAASDPIAMLPTVITTWLM